MADEFRTHRAPDDPDPRPFSVRVLAIIGGALGLTGILVMPLLLMPLDVPSWFDHIWRGPTYPADPSDVWLFLSTGIGIGLSVVLLTASIGCLYMRPWGRVLMIIYSVVSLLCSLAIGVTLLGQSEAIFGRGSPIRGFSTWFALCCWIAGTLYAAVTLFYMSHPSVRAAFREEAVYPDIPEYET